MSSIQKLVERYDLRVIALTLIISCLIGVTGMVLFIDEAMQDFISFYAASEMVWQGLSEQAYDLNSFVAYTQSIFPDAAQFAWFYPPTTLLASAPLALLPPFLSYLVITFGQLALFSLLIYHYFRKPHIVMFTLAGTAILVNAIYSQFGILWTSLLLLALQALQQGNQTKAGLWFAILSLKPHYGLIIPFALVAWKQWRCIAVTLTAIAGMVVASLLVFGADPWSAYWQTLTLVVTTTQDPEAFFGLNTNDMTNVISFAQTLGLPIWMRWILQCGILVICAFIVFQTWKQQQVGFAWKAAVLVLATIISMPWSFAYDMLLLNLWLAYVLLHKSPDEGLFQQRNHGILISLWLLPLVVLLLNFLEWIPDGLGNLFLLFPAWIMWKMRHTTFQPVVDNTGPS